MPTVENMTTPENVFKGDATQLAGIDIDSPPSKVKTPTCEYYLEAYGQVAKEAEEKGETQKAAVYRFLQVIVGFHPSFDTPSQPFVPMWQMEGKRSLIPSDLTAADIEVVRVLAQQTTDAALRARLHDVLWELANDHVAGAEAAGCYAAAAEKLDAAGDWTFAVTSFKRALYLASRFGRNKPVFEDTAKTVVAAAKRAATGADTFRCCQLMRLMLSAGVGEPNEFAAIASGMAASAKASGDTCKAKAYWEVEAEWQRRAKDAIAEQKAWLAAAEAGVTEAESRAQGKGASFMAAASLLAKAIEELRQAGAAKERIAELRRCLNEWQERSLAEFQSFSTGMDISKLVLGAREHVKGGDFPTAALKLAFGQDLSDPKGIKDEVVENAKQAPLTYLMGAAIVDDQGRTTARKESLLHIKGEAAEQALEAEAFSHASHFHWPLRVDGFVEPARAQILNDHKPTFQDLLFIVRNNPFIPPGHEGIFLRGLHAGFHGDFVVATHLLTPQIENSLRYVLESHGVDVSNLMSDGTQPVKVLGAIFGMAETKQVFGEPLCFELRGCLIEKTGYDFRNRVAHGFVHEGECYSHAGVTVWWLVWRICLTPIFRTIAEQKASAGQSA
ncbi:MAG: DUF4209 domain-containing protein [Verrucomicrobia bacterium]|nr:DUF4209 domain-containing protein [Verrucomicrobiota bacterium]